MSLVYQVTLNWLLIIQNMKETYDAHFYIYSFWQPNQYGIGY